MKLNSKSKIKLLVLGIGVVIVLIIVGKWTGNEKHNSNLKKTDYGSASEVAVVEPDSTKSDDNVAVVTKKTPDFTTFKINGKSYTLGSSTYNDLYINGWTLDEYGSQSYYNDFLTMTNAEDGTFLYTKLQNSSTTDDFGRKLYGIYQTSDESVCRNIDVCGITIGSSLDDVLKKLGNPKSTSEDNEIHQSTLEYVYKTATMSIVVATQDAATNTGAGGSAGSASAAPVGNNGVISIMISLPKDETPTVDVDTSAKKD